MPNFADFQGEWAIAREITDYMSGNNAEVTGTCTFARDDEGALLLREQGEMRLAGAGTVFETHRSYRWVETGGRIDVYFEDGRFFHQFDPQDACAQADHDCAPDVYEVRYDFSQWPQWQAHYAVFAPNSALGRCAWPAGRLHKRLRLKRG